MLAHYVDINAYIWLMLKILNGNIVSNLSTKLEL